MEERVYRFKRTAENLPSIARGIDPNEKNHHILNHFSGSRTTGALTDKRGTTRRGHAAEGSGSLSLFNGDCPRHSSSGLDVFQRAGFGELSRFREVIRNTPQDQL